MFISFAVAEKKLRGGRVLGETGYAEAFTARSTRYVIEAASLARDTLGYMVVRRDVGWDGEG